MCSNIHKCGFAHVCARMLVYVCGRVKLIIEEVMNWKRGNRQKGKNGGGQHGVNTLLICEIPFQKEFVFSKCCIVPKCLEKNDCFLITILSISIKD